MLALLNARFPVICQIANDGRIFPADVDILSKLHAGNANPRDFVNAVYDEPNMQAKELMIALSFPVVAPQAADLVAHHLEADLQLLLLALHSPRLRTVFGPKLLARNTTQWIDAVHEISVASILLGFYDQDTLELEKIIPGTANNSDTYGLRRGHPFRIDATVIHDKWPPPSVSGGPIGAVTRSTMDREELDDLLAQNPPGVVTTAQFPTNSATHTRTPLSTKVWQALQSKCRQCEQGSVNLIAIGLTRQLIDDNGTMDAVLGVATVAIDPVTGRQSLARLRTGPFVPEEYSPNVQEYIDPFRIMSGVWLVRWNAGYPASRVLPNPNATNMLPMADETDLAALGLARAKRP